MVKRKEDIKPKTFADFVELARRNRDDKESLREKLAMDDAERIRRSVEDAARKSLGSKFELVDMVNRPPHYSRGPEIALAECGSNGMVINWLRDTFERAGKKRIVVECIEVIRWIPDVRLATAIKYIWRVGFGDKYNDREDIKKAIWYLNDWLENSIDG